MWLVFNKGRSECVGFTDKQDAEQAAGIHPLGVFHSTLAGEWRQTYAGDDEDDESSDRTVFEMIEVTVP